MITGKEYLKKHIGETNIPEEHYENEIGEMMEWYADDYHQEQVKNLSLCDVSQQRELLKAYAELIQINYTTHFFDDAVEESIEEFLSL